ncbi:uncharacterized protein MYCFIDRAFT_83246 [Pseudocercospora fijiensis CIRAD86]|uniref:Chitin-binding type-4 domain-containing protein n=1 Tax=Pseudocercospora fijiensis (strain CIRAD86) TaxID=383855 RepID=M2YHN1_PSEFD|nr:uncharacterized protein MYCFIDRAFT_83246 [Pseudocercospora fijiensis CIRAD86]EME77300.1 hypothetical protein MYCFIDRAFT_83246 [Pseudocercospora fijiensis CIRAD86]
MKSFAVVSALVGLAAAHGYYQTPAPRKPGEAYSAACGEQAYNMMNSDINGNIQALESLGMEYDENTATVHSFSAGEEIPMYFQIVAPHTGYANVSVVDTATNSILAANLTSWDEYASTSVPLKAEWQNFTVTMPDTLGGKCATAGECVIQMHWNAPPPVDQTYQSCIDFTLAGSNSSKRSHARGFS